MMREVALVGYSGHAYVVADSAQEMGLRLLGYYEASQKSINPFGLAYLGNEKEPETISPLFSKGKYFFVAIGMNKLRAAIMESLLARKLRTLTISHPSALISSVATVGNGSFLAPGCKVNALAHIKDGVIINTGAVVEHECLIDDYVHIAPGAVLAGNVAVGEGSFVGANTVVKEGVRIGRHVTVGAGSVILHDIADNEVWVGNPGKLLRRHG